MTVKPRTIDNLGIDSSIRYAKDKELLDPRLIKDSQWVPSRTEVSVTRPYVPTEYEELFSLGKTVQWALFGSPPDFEAHVRSLFSYQLIPSLGGYEKTDADMEKLEALEDALHKENKDQENERQKLLALLKCIKKLDKTLTLINARRNQYQRG